MTRASEAASDAAAPRLRIRDLGPMLLEKDGQARPVPKGRLANAFALLSVHAGRRVGLDALADAMWGDRTRDRAASTLDSHVLRLRKLLEPERAHRQASAVLVREAGGYRLAAQPDQVDSLRFARLAVDAADLLADGSAARALRRTEEALGSWRGRPYGDAADEPWAVAAVARLDELHSQIRETHIGALLASGATDQALAELTTALAEHPLRERLWAYRMTAHRNAGRRAEALATYAEARTTLVDELGLEPGPELRGLHAALLTDEPPTPPAAPVAAVARTGQTHLPAAAHRLIGRDHEVAALTRLVADRPLVTIAGTAGCGKTRLSIEVARRVTGEFVDGVWFVDLTSATPDRVLDVVCSTVELPASGDAAAGLRAFARDRRMLLVLDNCEHVIDAAAELVEQLLIDGGETAVLATSRESLDVAGEHVHGLAPLATDPAVELFLERVAAAGSTETDMDAATRVVTALDGLPLALELAAGRARAYALAEIDAQVRADAGSLSHVGRRGRPAHHRSLRGAIDSSYQTLPAQEAALHRALSAVPGPFTVDLAAALIGTDQATVVDLVAGLVHRSLLTSVGPSRPGGPSRFAQLATIRAHGRHQAERHGEDPDARRDTWITAFVRDEPAFGSRRLKHFSRALDDHLPALRATLQHLVVDAPSAAGIGLVAGLPTYWHFSGRTVESLHWRRAAAAACDHDPGLGVPADRARVFLALGAALIIQRKGEEGRRVLRTGIAACHELGAADARSVCAALAMPTGPTFLTGDLELSTELGAAAARLGAPDPATELLARHAQFVAPYMSGSDPDMLTRVIALHQDAVEIDNLYTASVAAMFAVQLLLPVGRFDDALAWCRRALADGAAMGMREHPFAAEALGCAHARAGDLPAAARVLAAAEAQHVRAGMRWPTLPTTDDLLDTVTGALGRDGIAAARAGAADLSLDDLARL
jgi:predicted ATPase/DNA-binding SARP family transcriptional activator